MYYEEEVVNGVLCHRSDPRGVFIPFTARELTIKVLELKQAAQHGVEPTELPRAYLASELTNEQLEYLLTLGGSR